MADVVISYAGEANSGGYGDKYPFRPCLWTRHGEMDIMRAWIELDGMVGEIILVQLAKLGFSTPEPMVKEAMLRYGILRLEPLVRELLAGDSISQVVSPTWVLGRDEKNILLELATAKTCDYQTKVSRDLFCTIPSAGDGMANALIAGRPAAPTSRPVCNGCELPSTDHICSHLLHPATIGVRGSGYYARKVNQALCDLGRKEVNNYANCRIGGHSCAQRVIEFETALTTPRLSALGVAESFDVLDAHWRLAFGKTRRLVTLSTMTGPAALSLGCTDRTEFESRLSALADIIDRLSVDDDLLPAESVGEKGSLNRLEICLKRKLPPERHVSIGSAIQTMRRIRHARNAAQHGIAEGGLTERLAVLGITDAPPNWAAAWDAIRSATIDALTLIREELRWWIDSTSA